MEDVHCIVQHMHLGRHVFAFSWGPMMAHMWRTWLTAHFDESVAEMSKINLNFY